MKIVSNLRITYNSPVILTFALLAGAVFLGSFFTGGLIVQMFFSARPNFNFFLPFDYLRLFSYVLGHQGWNHLLSNLIFILMIGPLIEAVYGSLRLLLMMAATALITSILNIFFFSTCLVGASGIVFMLIILGSFTNSEKREIPLTFILVAALFIPYEILGAFYKDNVSQFGHIIGGACGSVFGFYSARKLY